MTPAADAYVVSTESALVWVAGDGVIRHVVVEGSELELHHAKANLRALVRATQGTRRPMIADLRKIRSATREVREYYASQDAAEVVSAVAILIESPVSRVIGNFFMKLNRPLYPIQLFSVEDKALEWLATLG